MEYDPNSPLTQRQIEAIDLLVAGELTTKEVAEAIGCGRPSLWRWRSKPEFQAEYRKRLALVEQEAMDYAISRRVNRVAALNEVWLGLREEIADKGPRPDLVYALIATSTAAAKELGQWQEKVDLTGRIEQRVQVIRFEAQAGHPQQEAIDAQYREVSAPNDPEPDDVFSRFMVAAGWPAHPSFLDPEHAPAMRRAIEDAGLDPATVLSPEQFRHIYGTEE